MKVHLSPPEELRLSASVAVTGSKSESNRLLLLKALYPGIAIENLSNSDDAVVMERGLQIREGVVDIHHAGTAMRFLTAFFATSEGRKVTLTGSARMKERPISILVDALRQLGADITYQGNTGYPPLQIKGKKISDAKVQLPANVSSQYISALLLVAAGMEHGLELELTGKITSLPYIKMTLGLLERVGIESRVDGQNISVYPKTDRVAGTMVVESDWSSASYFYAIAALAAPGTEIGLTSYRRDSLQGDSVLSTIYRDFGVATHFEGNSIILRKTDKQINPLLSYNLADAPDLAQTIAVTCFGLGVGCDLSGLHTLKIKETDRLLALETELGKLGASLSVTDQSLHLKAGGSVKQGVAIDTYNDHRMAMAFAPMALKTSLTINDAEVVSKSYPDYWRDLKSLGILLQEGE